MSNNLIKPHGGNLINCYCDQNESQQYKNNAVNYNSHILTDRQLCDLELILNGAFSPLDGFMNKECYNSVLEKNRLLDGNIWPIPIILDVKSDLADKVQIEDKLALRDKEGYLIAIIQISDKWNYDKSLEAQKVYGTTDITHTGVRYIFENGGDICLGGKVVGIEHPHHHDFLDIRLDPVETRRYFENKGWDKIVAFQTRNPMHRAHKEIMQRAAEEIGGHALLHPVVGMTKQGDVDYFTRVRCYQKIIQKFPEHSTALGLLPLSMRMAGPREALWHAIIRKNYGCTHFIIGRDHAGPGNDKNGNPFYGPYDAQEIIEKYKDEIGIQMIPFKFLVYLPGQDNYKPIDEVPDGVEYKTVSGSELREYLDKGMNIPDWFTYKEVAEELQRSRPKKTKRGFTVFFTGLSGSGKSTLANGLLVKLLENGNRPVTLLDGDIVRTHLSSELGFSKEHRSLNVTRIGYVASEITKNKGIAICAPIAPYKKDRRSNRELISTLGGYIEVYVSTSLEKCEERDAKGLYKLAREGIVKEFTGISDPYEAPVNPEIVIDSSGTAPEKLVDQIYNKIIELGYI